MNQMLREEILNRQHWMKKLPKQDPTVLVFNETALRKHLLRVIDSFESKICATCSSYKSLTNMCYKGVDLRKSATSDYEGVPSNFGCNRWN